MRSPRRTVISLHTPRPALSLVEVTVSVAIVGVMMVAALTTLASVALTRRIDADGQVGRSLGEDLMAEILSKHYEDPDEAIRSFGTELDEQTWPRSLYDDVDDYAGWTASPPQNMYGAVISDRTGWTRSVEVVCVRPDDFSVVLTPGFEMGFKRITVTVSYHQDEVAELIALRGRTREHPL